jgi:ParB-like chromosome segregation protein Spo0J
MIHTIKGSNEDRDKMLAAIASIPALAESGPGAVDFGGMTIQVRRVSDLHPAPYNPRTIDPEAMAGLRRSVKEFGLVEPIVWNRQTSRVVGGHQRLQALSEMGVQETPVVVVDLDETREKALNLALNNPAITGEFTPDVLGLVSLLETALPPDLFAELRYDEIQVGKIELPDDDSGQDGQPASAGSKVVTCPKCGHVFET